ncbi:cytochrome P450 [Aspergillus bertholletiae]|uniref:Cytochrome P450 n=1 Tax=Aspergillus bertholletiae TaxID=1226010 RepID=A0A5N7B8U5_9EURO|nr:cytochrome P450 [Aspergillus bertholletiae]
MIVNLGGIIFVLAVIGVTYALAFVGRRGQDYPDGPPTLPLIGNAHQIPRKGAHFLFAEMAKKYGDMFSLKVGWGTIIILSNRRIIKELLDRRSSTTSNRPVSTVAQTITGGDHLLVMDSGPTFRLFRKLLHQELMESICDKKHIKLQNAEAVQMLHDFVAFPQQHMLHPKRFSNSVIMSILYGIRTASHDAPHMTRLYQLMDHWSEVMELGATPPVDVFPFLKWLPERFLGNWKSRVWKVHNEMNELYKEMLERVINRRNSQGNHGSFMDKVLDKNVKLGLTPHQLYFLGGVAMEGGSDTSSGIIIACMQALTKWPDVQKKAQQEIDSVVDESRSPTWSDFEQLPYVTAIIKETQRWRSVGGLGIPHSLSQDEWIDGKHLPKGATVFINGWALHHDERRYPNHDVFDPDRYAGYTRLASEYAVSSDYENRDHYNYGTGRRLCPGVHLAERNLFLGISKLLWAFNFEKEIDGNGNPVEPDTDPVSGYSEGFIISAKPFPCRVSPRSDKRQETIMREYQQAESDVFSTYNH